MELIGNCWFDSCWVEVASWRHGSNKVRGISQSMHGKASGTWKLLCSLTVGKEKATYHIPLFRI